MAASSTDAGLLSPGLGLGRHGDKPRGSAVCPRAVPAEPQPRSDLPLPAQSGPARPLLGSAPRRDPSPGARCAGGALAPLPVRTSCRRSRAVRLSIRTPGLDAPEDPGGGAVGPGSPSACPWQPCPPTTPRCHPPKAGTCTTSHLGPQAPWLCLRSPEPPVRKPPGSWGSGVAAGVSTSYFPLQTLGRPGPPPTCNTPARPSPPACLWPSRAHAQRVLPAILLRPQFLLPWDAGTQPRAGCWVSPPQCSGGQLLEGRAGSCSACSVPSAVVTAGLSTFSLPLEETGRVSRGPRGSRRGGAAAWAPSPRCGVLRACSAPVDPEPRSPVQPPSESRARVLIARD